MNYSIVIFPSKQLQDIANSYRKRYDKKYALIPPHITLKKPFEASEKNESALTNQLQQIAHERKPFTIYVTHVKSFHPANKTIYFKVEESTELSDLHKALHLDETIERLAFVPHITIAQDLTNDEHFDIRGQLTNTNLSHQEMVDRIHLLREEENGKWSVVDTFRLGDE